MIGTPASAFRPRSLNATCDLLSKSSQTGNGSLWCTTIVRTATGIAIQEEDREPVALIPKSATYFLAPGELTPLSFERDERGRVARLIMHAVEDEIFERQD